MTTINADLIQTFFSPDSEGIRYICLTAAAMKERIESLETYLDGRITIIFISGAFIAGAGAFAIMPLVPGTVVCLTASFFSLFCLFNQFIGIPWRIQAGKTWLQGCVYFVNGQFEYALEKFDEPLKLQYQTIGNNGVLKHVKEVSNRFKLRLAADEFFNLDIPTGLPTKNLLAQVQITAGIFSIFREMQNSSKLDSTFIIEQSLTNDRDWFSTAAQREIYSAAKNRLAELQQIVKEKIQMPKSISTGHGILLELLFLAKAIDPDADQLFDASGDLINKEAGSLAGWKNSVLKAQEWMEKNNVLDTIETQCIGLLLGAPTMREFMERANFYYQPGPGAETLEAFKENFVKYE